jgi:hypothetical protein
MDGKSKNAFHLLKKGPLTATALGLSVQNNFQSYVYKREITIIVLEITALIAALAPISYGVTANHVTAKNLTKIVETPHTR